MKTAQETVRQLQAQIQAEQEKASASEARFRALVQQCEAEGQRLDQVQEFLTLDQSPAPQKEHDAISKGKERGRFDHLRFPSFFAFSISSDIRSSCSSETSEPPLPRRVATAFSAEPSKKVSIVYLNTDR